MAERIAEAIERDDRLFVEAGTGTGKTMAYLVPALLSGRKVVVSTGTKTLQDQIARIDLPRLRSILPQPFEWSVMKGLGNYLCLRRLEQQTRQASFVANARAGPHRRLDGADDDRRPRRSRASCPTIRRCGARSRRRRRRGSARAARSSSAASSPTCGGARWTRSWSS